MGTKKPKKKKKKDKSSKQDDAVVAMEVEVKETDIIEKKKKKGGKNKENVEQNVDLIDNKTAKKKKGNQPSDADVVEQCIPELKKKSKKRKRDVAADESVEDSLTEVPDSKKTKFEWDEVMVTLLEKQDDSEMSLKKLKKKCIAEFLSRNEGTHKTKEELGAKFNKKLKKRKYIVLKDRVKLRKDEEEVEEKIVQQNPPEQNQPEFSFNKWEATDLGSSSQTEKFRRLMGIKTNVDPNQVKNVQKRDDKKMFTDLEENFEKARKIRQGGRGMGLGFST